MSETPRMSVFRFTFKARLEVPDLLVSATDTDTALDIAEVAFDEAIRCPYEGSIEVFGPGGHLLRRFEKRL